MQSLDWLKQEQQQGGCQQVHPLKNKHSLMDQCCPPQRPFWQRVFRGRYCLGADKQCLARPAVPSYCPVAVRVRVRKTLIMHRDCCSAVNFIRRGKTSAVTTSWTIGQPHIHSFKKKYQVICRFFATVLPAHPFHFS